MDSLNIFDELIELIDEHCVFFDRRCINEERLILRCNKNTFAFLNKNAGDRVSGYKTMNGWVFLFDDYQIVPDGKMLDWEIRFETVALD